MFLSQRLEWLFWTYSSQNLLKFKVYEGQYAFAKYCDGTFNTGKISIKQTNKKGSGDFGYFIWLLFLPDQYVLVENDYNWVTTL